MQQVEGLVGVPFRPEDRDITLPRKVPAESRIPVFRKQPSAPAQSHARSSFSLRSHDNTSKRPSSLFELFGRNKVGAVPTKPMSVESTRPSVVSTTCDGAKSEISCVSASKIEAENVKNVRAFEEARCEQVVGEQDVNTEATVTAAHVGHRVCVSGTKVGILRYYGEINLTSGLFCGVELDEPAGLNDGSVQGVKYFTCRPQHGIIAPVGIVRPLPQQPPDISLKTSVSISLDESGPFSLLDDITMEQVEDNLQTQSSTSTPTPSSVASNAVLWEVWGQHHSISATSLVSSHSQHQSQSSQQLSKQNSLELDESVGIALSEQSSPVGSQLRHHPQHQSQLSQQLSKQSSFELDESLGILTPDQMMEFTVCADRTAMGRTPSFDDMGVFLLGDLKSDNVEDFLPDRLPSESDGPSSSNYPSSEFPQLPDDALDSIFHATEKVTSAEHFVISQVKNVSMQELELLSNDLVNQQQITPKTVFCVSDDLSDNICPVVSKSSDGDFRAGQDISDRTLSPEDLPMDAPFQEAMGESLQKVEITLESHHDTAGPSGATSTGPSSRSSAAPLAPSSFVTSVTSITSLDNGYQGDGEWSRPGSRGADQSPTNHRVVKLKTPVADSMTDSDFFTESDADTHDDVGAGSGRGDRRAQVIDGTLYGTNLHAGGTVLLGQQHQRCPSFTASINEEMESSGVYSDLERRPEDVSSVGKEVHTEDQTTTERNFSPDGSTKTVSSCSEQSQYKEHSLAFTTIIQQTMPDSIRDLQTGGVDENDLLTGNNTKKQQDSMVLIPVPVAAESNDLSSLDRLDNNTEVPPPAAASVKPPSATSNSDLNTSTSNKSSKGDNHHQSKKHKVPKKNVVSKIKAMIESSSPISGRQNTDYENQENQRPTCFPSKSLRKNVGRWDAVMNKIAQGQAEQKMKPRNLKEVKSKVFANITLSPGDEASRRTRKTNCSSLGPSVSLRTLKENPTLKAKSCRSRTAQKQEAPGNGTTSLTSSLHSSISDVSVSQSRALGKASTKSSSSLRSLKKRDAGRSASPLSDGSTSHVTTRSSRQPLQKNGASVTAVVDMKTPAARKQASRRIAANSGQKPTPLRDHNRQEQADGGLFKSGSEAPPSSKPGEVSVTSPKPAPQPQPQPTPAEILLPQLQHNSSGFEALGVLVQYLVYSLDAFSTPRLQKNLENMKTEWLKCKLKLEEAEVSYQRMEENLKQENVLCHQKIEELEGAKRCELAARDTKHSCEIAELVARHEAELCDFEKRLKEQLEEMKGRYEAELSRADQKYAEKLEIVEADGKAHLEKVQCEHAAAVAHLQADTFQREAELRHRLAGVEEEYSALKAQSRKLIESMQKDKDTKLQVTAGRCKELQDDVESLKTVLDLRLKELQELRKQNALLTREAEELPVALQRVAALEAKVEDLQVQLKVKTGIERQLSQDNRLLMESFHQESKQSKRLSLHNEELQWKLKQNFEVVLAALSGGSASTSLSGTLQNPPTNGRRSVHSTAQSLTDIDTSAAGNQLFTSRIPPCTSPAGRSYNSSGSDVSADPATSGRSVLAEDIDMSPPVSPKVKAVVEKSDSVSWVVEMDETPEALLSRLVRRAGSFRSTVSPAASVPSPARAKTLPPPKRQRHKASSLCLSSSATAIARPVAGSQSRNVPLTSSLRFRSRSISTDSVEDMGLDCGSWNATTSTPVQKSYGDGGCEDDMVLIINNNESCMKHCGADVYGNDDGQNVSSAIHNLSGVSNGTLKRETSDYSNEEDSPSKSSGSCGSSEGSQKDHDRSCFQSRTQISGNLTDPSAPADSLDLGEPEILQLPPLPGSTNGDLSFLSAQSLPAPKESAGEAMISEETSEDENDNADEINTSSDEHSCSEDEETSSSSGSLSDLRQIASRGLLIHETREIEHGYGNQKQEEDDGVGRVTEVTAGQQNMSAVDGVRQFHVLISESAATTTMDLSWSEDIELMPSESDG